MYDYLIVGAGLYGAVFAHQMKQYGKECLIIEKRSHIGGNCYTETIEDITVHKYGAHIFHTSNRVVWDYVNSFVEFNRYTNSPLAIYKGNIYNLPFNMNTFNKLWGVKTPSEAKAKIEEQKSEFNYIKSPKNLEEQALILGGRDIYEILIKGYTEKQWGRPATELPSFIIRRLPFRFNYDNNYFNDSYQGIPIGGYTKLVEKLLDGIEVRLNTNYFTNSSMFKSMAKNILFTGEIDRYFNYCFGKLEYRSLIFENELLNIDNFQGNAVINYTEKEIPYTRIIEHKHFENKNQAKTYISREYSTESSNKNDNYYPINDKRNQNLYSKYEEIAKKESSVIFGGRLAEFKYYDMHNVIEHALNKSKKILYGN